MKHGDVLFPTTYDMLNRRLNHENFDVLSMIGLVTGEEGGGGGGGEEGGKSNCKVGTRWVRQI